MPKQPVQAMSKTLLVLPLLFTIAACSDDGGTSPTDPDANGPSGPSEEEAQVMGAVVGQALAGDLVARSSPTNEGSLTFDETRDCPVSGFIHARGSSSVSSTDDNGTVTFFGSTEMEYTAEKCKATAEGQSVTFTTPSPFILTSSGHVTVEHYGEPGQQIVELDYTIEWTGTFLFDLDGDASVTCDIDMQMRMTLDAALYELSWEGTVCGHSVDSEFTLEAPSSPTFGDLTFTPSFENIGSGRSTQITVRNVSSTVLGPVLLGVDDIKRTTMPDSLCSTIDTDLAPGSIASLAPDEAVVVNVTFDTQNVDIVDCPAGQYDADLFAAVSGTVLTGATVRFDWDGTPP